MYKMASDKEKRYDRQLRLWGDDGQLALESANVCLINATPVGTEILKNLALPGIGKITIIDDNTVTSRDLGENFFLSKDSIGVNRGVATANLISELNETVAISTCLESLSVILQSSNDYFNQFTVVIATGLPPAVLGELAALLWQRRVPLLIARSYGLLGYLRLVVDSHEVIESHPDNYHEDLRLDAPFSDLTDFADSIDLESLDNAEHSNVPYLIILYKYLQIWRLEHDDKIPRNYKEKKAFKELLHSGIRVNEDGVPLDEENFQEAISSVNSVLVPTSIPVNVQEILDHSSCLNVTADTSNYWLLCAALREYIANEGSLPLRGSIPDMISSSKYYIDLQRVYQKKAQSDIATFTSYLNQVLGSVGKPPDAVSDKQVKLFCRNAAFLRLVQSRSLSDEYNHPKVEELSNSLTDPDNILSFYVLLRSSDIFYTKYKYYPGSGRDSLDSDSSQLKVFLCSLLEEWGLSPSSADGIEDKITEFCRFGGGEVHSVAAFIGGVASQEVIKVITRQYVPINNTYIYNAATSTSITVAL